MSAKRTVTLTGRDLTVEQVAAVARGGSEARLSPEAERAVARSWQYLQQLIDEGRPIYGVTTGFGALDAKGVAPKDNRRQQRNLLRSHAAGVGKSMAADAVRAMMLIRANVLAGGMTGVQPETLAGLLAMLDRDVVAVVPECGSVGACGDLAPLAHMALPLIGEGRACYRGELLPGAEAMQRAEIPLPDVRGRDGLALINGTEQTTGIGCLAMIDAKRLVRTAEAAAAMTLEATGALTDSFSDRVAAAKPYPGLVATARRLKELTASSRSVGPPSAGHLRDGLSLRCVPQVLGATRDALSFAEQQLTVEINSANDNPLLTPERDWVTSNSGNFHGQSAGEALDYLAMSVASLAVMSERRSARLVDPHHNGGLPAFLIHPDASAGLNSGFMIAQYTAASLVAELRTRSVPASIQSVPTSANTEDHVPMSPIAARHAEWVIRTAEQIVAIELLLAAQALDIRSTRPGDGVKACHNAIRGVVPVMVEDRILSEDIKALVGLIRTSKLS